MIEWVIAAIVSLAVALVVGWGLPSWAVRRLLPALEGSQQLITNYRGRRIPTGLGLVWIVWATGIGVTQVAVRVLISAFGADATTAPLRNGLPLEITLLLPVTLVAGAFGFGMLDDVFGGHAVKGFRGHLKEIASGRLSTGGLKLVGIGLLSIVAGAAASAVTSGLTSVLAGSGSAGTIAVAVLAWACASLVIALTANFVNLTDLRPGRALKVYSLLAVVGIAVVVASEVSALVTDSVAVLAVWGVSGAALPAAAIAARALCLAIVVIGPVLAVWRLDLGELGMLGDAGANAMGALAGYLLVARSPLWLDVVWLVIMLALNLASERFSFSKVIERTAFLKRLDDAGRLPADPDVAAGVDGDDGGGQAGPAAEDDDAREDGGR